MDGRKRVYHLTELKNRRRDLRKRSTSAERLLWEKIRNNQLGVKFRRQYSVTGYVVDFYCAKKKIAIELGGGVHNKPAVIKYDQYRTRYLEAFGIKILKFKNGDIYKDIEKVVESLRLSLLCMSGGFPHDKERGGVEDT
jgi:cyclase